MQEIVRLCAREGVPFVPRGHGTGLSGGALPVEGGIVIALSRLNRVLDVDIPNRRVTVEPGVTNLEITRQVAPFGYYYAPDPSSQQVCSIGGNVAENSGGAHCLKYGFTVHHVLAADVVLPTGELVQLGSEFADAPGPDLLGLLIGSEGTLAIVDERSPSGSCGSPKRCRRCWRPSTRSTRAARAVSDIIGAGIIPAAIEMMDALAIQAAEAAVHPGFPPADTVLIVELDGPEAEVRGLFDVVEQICRRNGATTIEVARTEPQRARIWKGRKAAFAAMGRVSPNYYVQDGVVPRTRLPEVLNRIRQLERTSGLRIGNVFHAGDGNLHPLICYDEKVPGQAERAEAVAAEILGVLRRSRRIADRRARRRRGQVAIHAADVQRRRSGADAARARRLRSARPLQSRQGLPDAAPLRRSAGPVSRASGRTRRARRALLMTSLPAELIAAGHALDTRAGRSRTRSRRRRRAGAGGRRREPPRRSRRRSQWAVDTSGSRS